MVQELFKLRFPKDHDSYPVLRSGSIVCGSRRVVVDKVLFDSGALHSSYVSVDLVNKYREEWSHRIRNVEGFVKLADQETVTKVNERITLDLEFIDENGGIYSAPVDMCVFSMPSMDIIIGLPDILGFFMDLFIEMITVERRSEKRVHFVNTLVSPENEIRDNEQTLHPWKNEHDELAPEELNTEIPCSFSGPLYYLSKPHDQVIDDYREMFKDHVAEDWKLNTNVLDILLSKEALQVFVPKEWTGISGFEPVEFEWLHDMPTEHRPPYRPINPKLFNDTKKEFERMCQYMYRDSDSAIAVPLVVAPKATTPFIRICGDYVWINKYIVSGHYYIPHVMHELEKAAEFKYFIDLDLTNSFHQIILGEHTSKKLSVTTPWGLKRPVFLPEGVSPASGILQRMVMTIFADFSEWTITLFDNILVLCNSYEDGIVKLKSIIQRCYERNVVLKFAKSWIGFQQVKFFGYKVTPGKYELDEERKQSVLDAPMPSNAKAMQRFLGVAVFFNEFIPNYSTVTSKLYDMIKPTFDWKESTWKENYKTIFEEAKIALANSTAKHFPNYELDWILRTDASQTGVAAVLLQIQIEGDKKVYQPIGFKSHKLSGPATRWDTHKQEAFAIYFGVKTFAYYLYGKKFIIETDHRNLLWMENSDALIVIRWRIYLQSFQFLLRDIKGKDNIVADWGSRLYNITGDVQILGAVAEPVNDQSRAEYYFTQVHGGRMFHPGVRETFRRLNEYFPGHGISQKVIQRMVEECPRCQKDRLVISGDIKPIVRTLIPEHHRTRIGIDALTITPEDENGNCMALVVVEQKTKHTAIYPAKQYDQVTAATAIFQYMCTFGLHDEIISDPGSMFLSDTVAQLNSWLGLRHKVSLVDVHESNGVERTNQEILRHLRSLCNDDRIRRQWSQPHVLCLIEFALNSRINTETSHSAFELKFGSEDAKYFKLPEDISSESIANEWLKNINQNLIVIRQLTNDFQKELIIERTKHNPPEELQNQYQPGDYVLYDSLYDPSQYRRVKLDSRYKGPYEVLRQHKDEVECRHLCMGFIKVLLVERLKRYIGNYEDAYRLALEDADQFNIERITAWRGDPGTRTTMEFEVLFSDGEVVWKPFDQDLFNSIPYETYCNENSEVYLLKFTVAQARKEAAHINSLPITKVTPGDIVYLDIRYFNTYLYDTKFDLPDKYHLRYVVKLQYTRWIGQHHKKIDAYIEVFNEEYRFNNLFVHMFGHHSRLQDNMIEVTSIFLQEHPFILDILPKVQRDKVLRNLPH